MKKSILKKGVRFFQYIYTISIWLLCLFFVKCIIPQPTNYLGSGAEEKTCDIYTERCPRSGSGFGLVGSGGDTNRSISFLDAFNDTPGSEIFEEYITDTKQATGEICQEYDKLFKDIEEGLSVSEDDTECIEFEGRTVFCPIFDYVNGCLRVREIDNPATPATTAEESDNFDAVCVNSTDGDGNNITIDTPVGESVRELLRDRLEEIISGEANHQAWLQERDDLTETEFNKWRGDELDMATGDVTIGDETCDERLSVPTVSNLESRFPNEDIQNIYDARNDINSGLNGIKQPPLNSRLKRKAEELDDVIFEIKEKEALLMQIDAEIAVCENELEGSPDQNRTEEVNGYIENLEGRETRTQDELLKKDEELHALSVEVLDYFYDRLSEEDRKGMVDRLLERQKRDFRRALVLCIYEEDPNCLSSIGAYSVTEVVTFPDFPQSIETRNYIIRKYVDQVARKIECQNGLQYEFVRKNGQIQYVDDGDSNDKNDAVQFRERVNCTDPITNEIFVDTEEEPNITREKLSEYKEELSEAQDEVDTLIGEFQVFMTSVFNTYFTQPYGVACSAEQIEDYFDTSLN